MLEKRHKAEESVAKLRQVEVFAEQGLPVAGAARSIGVNEVTIIAEQSQLSRLKS